MKYFHFCDGNMDLAIEAIDKASAIKKVQEYLSAEAIDIREISHLEAADYDIL